MHKINGHRPVDILHQLWASDDRLFNHSVHLSRGAAKVTTMGGSGFSGLGPLNVSEKGSVSKKDGGLALVRTDNEVCLAWVADALQLLRQEGHTKGRAKAVTYLEAVLAEVVFEMKMAPRS